MADKSIQEGVEQYRRGRISAQELFEDDQRQVDFAAQSTQLSSTIAHLETYLVDQISIQVLLIVFSVSSLILSGFVPKRFSEWDIFGIAGTISVVSAWIVSKPLRHIWLRTLIEIVGDFRDISEMQQSIQLYGFGIGGIAGLGLGGLIYMSYTSLPFLIRMLGFALICFIETNLIASTFAATLQGAHLRYQHAVIQGNALKKEAHELGEMGNFRRASEKYQEAIHIFRYIGYIRAEAATYIALGRVAKACNSRAEASAYFHKALSLLETHGENDMVAECLSALADLAAGDFDYEKALKYEEHRHGLTTRVLQKHLAELDPPDLLGHDSLLETPHSLMGLRSAPIKHKTSESTFKYIGLSEKAERHGMALACQLNIANSLAGLGHRHQELAEYYLAQDDSQRAKEHFEQALMCFEEPLNLMQDVLSKPASRVILDVNHGKTLVTCRRQIPELLNAIGAVHHSQGNLDSAQDYYQRAFDKASEVGWEDTLTNVHINLGMLCQVWNNHEEAIHHFDQGLDICKGQRTLGAYAKLHFKRALSYRALGRLVEAKSDLEECVQIYEEFRPAVLDDESRKLRVGATYLVFYEKLIEVLHMLEENELAFWYAEKSKAQALLDILTIPDRGFGADVDPSLIEHEQRIRHELETLYASAEDSSQTKEAIEQKLDELTQVRERIRLSSPRYAALAHPDSLTVDKTQRELLADDTLLVEYFVGTEASYLWVVSQGSFTAYKLSITQSELAHKIDTLRWQIGKVIYGMQSDTDALCKELYRLLIEPVGAILSSVQRLIIVPDGPLYYLPFEILLRNASENNEVSTEYEKYTRRLFYTYPISYISSTTALLTTRTLTSTGRTSDGTLGDLVAFGDPDLGNKEKFQSLPDSGLEAQRIVAMFGPKSRYLLGKEATKENALRELPKYKMIHLATHAHVRDKYPALSHIVFAQANSNQTAKALPERLYTYEIFSLPLQAKLVVLSACDTARGELQRGEGVIGLTRAFLYTGAQAVVSNVWAVSDSSTAILMERFYSCLIEGEPVDKALRNARLDLIRHTFDSEHDTTYDSLYFWAPIMIFGDGHLTLSDILEEKSFSANEQGPISLARHGTGLLNLIDQAKTELSLEHYQQALNLCDEGLKAETDNVEFWIIKSTALLGLQKIADALSAIGQAIYLNPSLAKAWYQKGKIYIASGEMNNALTAFQRARELDPRHDGAWVQEGVVYAKHHHYFDALDRFEQAIEINRHNAEAWANKAICLYNLGRFEEAAISNEQAVGLDPKNKDLLNIHDMLERLIIKHTKGRL